MTDRYCELCGSSELVENHHIIKRSQVVALIDCEFNQVDLCFKHHRGTFGVHGSKGSSLDKELKGFFQERLYMLFQDREYFTVEEISKILRINFRTVDRLCKALKRVNYKYAKEDIIRACMGGKLIV